MAWQSNWWTYIKCRRELEFRHTKANSAPGSRQPINLRQRWGRELFWYCTMKTAILVDGGFYRRMAQKVKGCIAAEERANELENYCHRHLQNRKNQCDDLYRIFYYDCMPTGDNIYHPYFKRQINYSKTDLYKWMNIFIDELKKKRKFALPSYFLFVFLYTTSRFIVPIGLPLTPQLTIEHKHSHLHAH